jgi:hypothetical protein
MCTLNIRVMGFLCPLMSACMGDLWEIPGVFSFGQVWSCESLDSFVVENPVTTFPSNFAVEFRLQVDGLGPCGLPTSHKSCGCRRCVYVQFCKSSAASSITLHLKCRWLIGMCSCDGDLMVLCCCVQHAHTCVPTSPACWLVLKTHGFIVSRIWAWVATHLNSV